MSRQADPGRSGCGRGLEGVCKMAGCILALFILLSAGPLRAEQVGYEEHMKGREQASAHTQEDMASGKPVPEEWIEEILKERQLLESLEMLEYMEFFSYSDRFSPHDF